MKLRLTSCLLALSFSLLTGSLFADDAVKQLSEQWPKQIELVGHHLNLYQPQIQSLKDNQLQFQMALAVSDNDPDKAHYGSLKAACRLDVDKTQDLAQCNHLQIIALNFPNAKANQLPWVNQVKQRIADKTFSLPLSSISAGLALHQTLAAKANPDYQFSPPAIYVSFKPTALITIDGKPQLRALDNSSLMRVINTPFIILLDTKSGVYYLQAGQVWMQAKAIEGPWIKTDKLPNAVQKISKEAPQQAKSAKPIEHVIVTTKPAALLQINGKPEFSPIEGTSLLSVSNSSDQIFMQIKSQTYFALLSGRWYQTKNLDGKSQWTYVSPKNLPEAFGTIPASSDKAAAVLSAVPGTPEAREAVIKNQIPQTAVVKRSEAKLSVQYDGKPKFLRIPGTPVYYATNTEKAVFRINQDFYANYQGVWFQAKTANGPWLVASRVPDAIYSIPPSSPHYNVTFSYIYDATPEVVYVGYTPGYMGSYVYQGTVIYGTGYYYPGWTGTVYYGYPVSYGFGFYYQPYGGWHPVAPYANPLWFGAGVAVGIVAANQWNHGWFGPNHYYNYHGGHNKINVNVNHNTNVYNHWSKNTVVKRNTVHNNTLFSNNRIQNRQTHEITKNKAVINKNTHETRIHQQNEVKRPSHVERPHVQKPNNIYSGKDGQVYRHHQGQWQQATPRGWEKNRNGNQVEHLNRERQYRDHMNRQFERPHRFR